MVSEPLFSIYLAEESMDVFDEFGEQEMSKDESRKTRSARFIVMNYSRRRGRTQVDTRKGGTPRTHFKLVLLRKILSLLQCRTGMNPRAIPTKSVETDSNICLLIKSLHEQFFIRLLGSKP